MCEFKQESQLGGQRVVERMVGLTSENLGPSPGLEKTNISAPCLLTCRVKRTTSASVGHGDRVNEIRHMPGTGQVVLNVLAG